MSVKIESVFDLYSIKDKTLMKEWKYCPPNASYSMAGLHFRVWQVGEDLYCEMGGNGGATVKAINHIDENPFQ